MANCFKTYKTPGTDATEFTCCLTEGHEAVFKRHYDDKTDTEWSVVRGKLHTITGRKPTPLPSTRTGDKAAIASASAITSQFEVVYD